MTESGKIRMASENLPSFSKTEPTDGSERYCNVKLETILLLKDSTKKLLCLIDDLQKKSTPSKPIPTAFGEIDVTLPILQELTNHIDDLPVTTSLKTLEKHITEVDNATIANIHECTIYERLTRKCNCLNRTEFNDLTIQFNEDTKYSTSELGEIIKNLRILKKFLYMGCGYSKSALIFLNEGLTKSPHSEKVDMLLACSHADICNVFDDESFVYILIRNPIKYETFADTCTQNLAARVLYRIAAVEEGRRYLNFNSKILNDVNHVVKRNAEKLNPDTTEFLNSVLYLLSPTTVPLIKNSIYYCKADEGMPKKILNSLYHFRVFMTTEEITVNLEWLNKMCDNNKGIIEMKQILNTTCTIFKEILLTYDNSKMNVIITSIMNKILKKENTIRNTSFAEQKSYIVTDTSTEPTETKDKIIQASPNAFNKIIKKKVKSRLGVFMRSNNKSSYLNRSGMDKFGKTIIEYN